MDALELIQRYEKGERNFSGVNLSKAKLIGAYLPGINLWGADLTGANLAKAKLWGANLSLANLAQANLTRANISGANFQQANLRGTRLYYIKYYGTNFINCTYDTSTKFSRGFDPSVHSMRRFE
jgi:uncharacterized protein YjbI with pentapeptide repeats